MRGFTLIEVLVALSIAAFALMALIGRLGASSDIQRTLIEQRAAISVAQNRLAEELLQPSVSSDDRSGNVEWQGKTFHWRSWTEKTELERFVRRNVSVTTEGEPEVELFVFLVLP